MLRRSVSYLLVAALCMAVPSLARAASISAVLSADDTFTIFVSTNDSVAGTSVCTDADNFWPTVSACGPAALTGGVTNYLHIQASDIYGMPSMLIGSFTLSDATFQFANGSQTLDTNAVNWVVRTTGFDGSSAVPFDMGPNGTGPWGMLAGINSPARFIWDVAGGCSGCTRYFSTPITPIDQTVPIPEPATLSLLGLGLAAAIRRSRRG